jgi:hypothetical protein
VVGQPPAACRARRVGRDSLVIPGEYLEIVITKR